MANGRSFLIRAQTEAPHVRGTALVRPRLSELFHDRIVAYDVVWVVATAGAGKTTAAVHALESDDCVAWLRLDTGVTAPGRLLLHLEAALLRVLPGQHPLIAEALERGIRAPEAAALLAEAIQDQSVVLVVDDVERLAAAERAAETLAFFLRYLGPTTTVVLIARREVDLGLTSVELEGRLGRITETDLAFSVDEAAAALTALSLDHQDAVAAVRATRGWVTGVLFDAWRSSAHVHGAGGEVDPLRSYLSSEIMASLHPDQSRFLILTAVLDVITPERARRIGMENSAQILHALAGAHLPLEFDRPDVARCHPRFREYLLRRWSELEASVRTEIRLRHGLLLSEERRYEDAVPEFLACGNIERAARAAEKVAVAIARRNDLDLVARWLAQFDMARVEASAPLTAAELLVTIDREEFGRAARAADRLAMNADTAFLAEEHLHGGMAWSYFLDGRVDDAVSLLDTAPLDASLAATRFCIGVELIDDPTHYRERPSDPHTEIDGLLARVDLAHGRFEEVIARPDNALHAVLLAQVGAYTGLGRLEDAWQRMPDAKHGWTDIRMRTELFAACEQPQEAWLALIDGRTRLQHSASPLYRWFALLAEAMLALRFRRDVAQARAALRAVEREPLSRRWIRIHEQLFLWRGLIALHEGDTGAAVRELRDAVELMTQWDRRLFLPIAAVYLAEAEWRAGEEDRADRAADLALCVARMGGSLHSISRALGEFPTVLSRRLDIEEDPDGPWHTLGRMVIADAGAPVIHVQPALVVHELDEPAIVIAGRRRRLKHVKSLELLSYLAVKGTDVSRSELIGALFDSKNDRSAQAYLRIAANGIREALDDPHCLVIEGKRVRWSGGPLTSSVLELRTAHGRLRTVGPAERLELALRALDDVEGRELLPGACSQWATEQRELWRRLILDLRQIAAEAAFEIGQFGIAHRLAQDVLRSDPYRERVWRLVMKIVSALGDGDGLLAAYRACEQALAEIPAVPADATRDLFRRLRV